MKQIVDWLNQLGMHEYAQRFAENDIDFIFCLTCLTRISKRLASHRLAIVESCCVPLLISKGPRKLHPR